GMVKVAGQRATDRLAAVDHGLELPLRLEEAGPSDELLYPAKSLSPENFLGVSEIAKCLEGPSPSRILDGVEGLTGFVERRPELHDSHRRIAAVLAGANGEFLGYGINSNAENKTLHAEVNLVQSFFRAVGSKLPKGAVLYSTHKPCKMCAGMLHDWSEDPKSLTVFYRHEEKGGLSRHTVLDRLGHQIVIP
ncbi:MAG TPA: Bd3614 family nucleic acid deaminase, partial [Pseudobdellovibrionaceae bacterium]|nr:Bd3614 family nucleic acid deaminase [Pseudobdellovibrionaceae bacterium]